MTKTNRQMFPKAHRLADQASADWDQARRLDLLADKAAELGLEYETERLRRAAAEMAESGDQLAEQAIDAGFDPSIIE